MPLAGDNQRKQQRSCWASSWSAARIWGDAPKEGKPHALGPIRLPAPPEHNSYVSGFNNIMHAFAMVMKMCSDLEALEGSSRPGPATQVCRGVNCGTSPTFLASPLQNQWRWRARHRVRCQTPSLWELQRHNPRKTSSWKHTRKGISMPQILPPPPPPRPPPISNLCTWHLVRGTYS